MLLFLLLKKLLIKIMSFAVESREQEICLDINTQSELENVSDLESAMKFTNTYGTDMLQCCFRRYRIRYTVCQVTPLKANTYSNDPIIYEDPKKLSEKLLDDEDLKLNFDTASSSECKMRTTVNNLEYLVTFYSGAVVNPIFIPVDRNFKWLVNNYK